MMSDFGHRTEHEDRSMWKVEVNIDDMSGEKMAYVLDMLLENGANDVYYTPIIMKKNRPSYMLTVLVSADKRRVVTDIIFRETTTLGVRYYPVACYRLERDFHSVHTEWGNVTVKLGWHGGELMQYAPEYEECSRIARTYNIPLKRVYEAIKQEAVKQLPDLARYLQS